MNHTLTLTLKHPSPPAWTAAVLADFDRFLIDHAACERKASGMAQSLCLHYPDKADLVAAMADLAVEELVHYREVLKWLHKQGLQQLPDEKDPYIAGLNQHLAKGKAAYLQDRLLLAAIIERRGHERFGLIAQALAPGELKTFYQAITQSEARHYQQFLQLAQHYCPPAQQPALQSRLDTLLSHEADIMLALPIRARLH